MITTVVAHRRAPHVRARLVQGGANVQRGANLYYVQKLMGHKSSAQIERYAKLLAPANLIETVALLEPIAA